jgi:arylsulfatase A-like enzyme
MTDVFLLSIDALRKDYFSREYFPKFWNQYVDEFALFKNAYSNGVATPLSFPSIHTGYQVGSDGSLSSSASTLAENYSGYSFAISNNPHLRRDRGYHRGFTNFIRELDFIGEDSSNSDTFLSTIKQFAQNSEYLRRLNAKLYNRYGNLSLTQPTLSPPENVTADKVLSALLDSVEERSGFFWIHLMEPHHPYYPQKVQDKSLGIQKTNSEIKRINDKLLGASARSMGLQRKQTELPEPTDTEISFCRKVYGEIVKYLDRKLTEFFAQLETRNRWQDSLVVLLADHGEAFGEQGVFQHDWTANPIDPLIQVPILVKYPNQERGGKQFDHPVQTGDLFATLSEELDWNVERPLNTHPFSDNSERPIISKSNNAIRVTTRGGYAIKRHGSIVETSGTVSSEAKGLLQSESLPSVENLLGDIPGIDKKEQAKVEQRLKHLGYK